MSNLADDDEPDVAPPAPVKPPLPPDPFELIQAGEPIKGHRESSDVPFIGFDRILTPQLPRRTVKSSTATTPSGLADLKNLLDGDLFGDHQAKHTFKEHKPTLSELSGNPAPLQFDELHKQAMDLDFLIDKASIKLEDVDPMRILDKMNIQILIYRATAEKKSVAKVYMMSIINTGPSDINDVKLTIGTNCINLQLQLEDAIFNLPAVAPSKPISSEQRMLRVLPLKEIHEIDLDFSMCFNLKCERRISGSFVLTL